MYARNAVIGTTILMLAALPAASQAQIAGPDAPTATAPAAEPELLTPQQWAELRRSLARATAWVSTQQQSDGSFRSLDVAQPAVTSLGVLAFLAAGHVPGEGPYGRCMERAIDFVLASQQPDGLLCYLPPEPTFLPARPSHTATYNHAIAGLMLTEAYGMTDGKRSAKLRPAIERALQYTLNLQGKPKRNAADRGGWRYIRPHPNSESDLSVTGWHLMFLRSAENAEFDVPSKYIDEAMQYVQRLFEQRTGGFYYGLIGQDRQISRAMVGAGILSLSMGGLHDTTQARAAGAWVLRNPFSRYNSQTNTQDRFHYGAYYCSQGMFQLGGRYWQGFYPVLFRTLMGAQSLQGSWQPENGLDAKYGQAYTTSLAVLALSPPLQILPIYQR